VGFDPVEDSAVLDGGAAHLGGVPKFNGALLLHEPLVQELHLRLVLVTEESDSESLLFSVVLALGPGDLVSQAYTSLLGDGDSWSGARSGAHGGIRYDLLFGEGGTSTVLDVVGVGMGHVAVLLDSCHRGVTKFLLAKVEGNSLRRILAWLSD